jgi:hypothetical protein
VTPELARYRETTFYGETKQSAALDAEALRGERDLWRRAEAAGLLATMPREVCVLGHNLVVHDSEVATGAAYLKALHAAAIAGNEQLRGDLYCATMAAGELGEKMVVDELAHDDADRRLFWARFLADGALYSGSAAPIEKRLASETDTRVQAALVRALASIGLPSSSAAVRALIEGTKVDEVQAAALWAYVELAGFDAIGYLDQLKPIGDKSRAECQQGEKWLRTETSAKSRHGREVGSDAEFVERFGDLLRCPTIAWLAGEKLLDEKVVETPSQLDAARKRTLLERLVDSRGFGLEAVKGSLFVSLAKQDEAELLRIRAAGFHAPNELSQGRALTLQLMVRHIRQDL